MGVNMDWSEIKMTVIKIISVFVKVTKKYKFRGDYIYIRK